MEPSSCLPSIRNVLHIRSTVRDSYPVPWNCQREESNTRTRTVLVVREDEEEDDDDDDDEIARKPPLEGAPSTQVLVGNAGGDKSLCCQVCDLNEWRYVCPQCETKYCSVSCYQNHQEGCTERFYQSRVNEVLQLEAKERQRDTRQLLTRFHQEQQQYLHDTRPTNDFLEVLPKEKLYKILQLVESGDDEQIANILQKHPAIRQALHHAIQGGELQDWLLEPWHPWWRPRLARSAEDTDTDDDESSAESTFPTLDDRILQIPRLNATKVPPHPLLQYNVIDLLYSVALTLRLYHGLDNALETAGSAAVTFLESSKVLSHDARYTSVAEALASCVCVDTDRRSRTSPSMKTATTTTPWEVLVGDVALLCRNRRLLARALLEASDLFVAATATAKAEKAGKELKMLLKLSWKKLQFYLSWSRDGPLPPPGEIEAWVLDWQPDSWAPSDLNLLPQGTT